MRCTVLYAATVAMMSALVAAQDRKSPTESRPTFEVASVKRNRSGTSGGRFGDEPGGRWSMVNTAVTSLIRSAYPARELVDVPSWVESEPYDVNAKAEGNPPREQISLMLQALLADRFKLAVHTETRERSIFALVVARHDRQLGGALLRSKVDCEAVNAARRAGRRPDGPLPGNGAPPCGWSSSGETLSVGGLPMLRVAGVLGKPDGRVIIDRTGLTGNFEFTLRYTTEPNSTDDRPSLFTALEEQLGLKLVSDRAPLEVLVIDHIERPAED